MTRDNLAALAALQRVLDERVTVWRVVINAKGEVLRRIYRGSFINTHGGSRDESPQHNEER